MIVVLLEDGVLLCDARLEYLFVIEIHSVLIVFISIIVTWLLIAYRVISRYVVACSKCRLNLTDEQLR